MPDILQYRKAKGAALGHARQRIAYGRPVRVLNFGDSLVCGSSGGVYNKTLTLAIQRALGQCGPGFFSGFMDQGGARGLIAATQTGSWWATHLINWVAQGWSAQQTVDVAGNFRFAFDGQGIFKAAGDGSHLVRFRCPRQGFTRATLYYLELPGGGSFSFGKTGDIVAVNAVGAAPVVRSISRRIWDANPETDEVLISDVIGAVYLLGISLDNDAVGGVSSTHGRGGETAAKFVQLDGPSWTAWIAALDPAVVILNLGTNDSSDSATFQANMQTLVDRIRAANATVPILLTIPHAGAVPVNYLAAMQALVTANAGTYLQYWDAILGAGGAGFLMDSIHPDAIGCALLGDGILDGVGGAGLASEAGRWPWKVAPYNLDNLILNPARNSHFTDPGTDWVPSGGGGGSIVLGPSGMQVNTGGPTSGARLSMGTAIGGQLLAGHLYHLTIRLSAKTTSPLVYPLPGSAPIVAWPRVDDILPTGQITDVGTDHVYIFRPTTDLSDLRLYAPSAGASFTVRSFEIRELE